MQTVSFREHALTCSGNAVTLCIKAILLRSGHVVGFLETKPNRAILEPSDVHTASASAIQSVARFES